MKLNEQSLQSLDWADVLQALSEHALTPMGRRVCRNQSPLSGPDEALRCFDAMDEILMLADEGADVPLGGIDDIGDTVRRAAKGEVLDSGELRAAGSTLEALRRLVWMLQTRADVAPVIGSFGDRIHVDDLVADELAVAFDRSGNLSEHTYPELAELRRAIRDLHTSIRSTLDGLVGGDELGEVLQDRYVTMRGDRYVLPVKAHAKRWNIGIVHGTSGSGATVYIEPREVVELNNRLRIAEGALAAAERRILTHLSRLLGSCGADLELALSTATELDGFVARVGLARRLRATRPAVHAAGVIELQTARHPVLALRGVDVVGNDLRLDAHQQALVLTGPNAGGKTVALKTIGLSALLVRIGAFVPAMADSRVDWFDDVLAAIGDAQTVHDDLSSFSGHIVQLREILDRSRAGTLVLLDELANGTDPVQGAALAQSVMEGILERGARLVVTTHFPRLKALAAADERFGAAAVEYVNGQPTYRVVAGASGESHAFALARRMQLHEPVVVRAEALLDDRERDLVSTLEALEAARDAAREEARQARDEAIRHKCHAEALEKRERELQLRARELEAQAAEGFIDRLRNAERAIGEVVANLQRSPSHRGVATARSTLAALEALAPSVDAPPTRPEAPSEFLVGQSVHVPRLGVRGEILAAGDPLQIRTESGLTVKVAASDVEPVQDDGGRKRPRRKKRRNAPVAATPRGPRIENALRLPGNTLDLRGMRVDEGLDAADLFLDRALRSGHDMVFLLHGHGTGVMKEAVREWARQHAGVSRWAPANSDQGGDAYTVCALRG